MGVLCAREGRYREAEAHYSRALRIRREGLGSGHQRVAETLECFAELLRLLETKNRSLADQIVRSCIRSFDDAEEDPAEFSAIHRRLLEERPSSDV